MLAGIFVSSAAEPPRSALFPLCGCGVKARLEPPALRRSRMMQPIVCSHAPNERS